MYSLRLYYSTMPSRLVVVLVTLVLLSMEPQQQRERGRGRGRGVAALMHYQRRGVSSTTSGSTSRCHMRLNPNSFQGTYLVYHYRISPTRFEALPQCSHCENGCAQRSVMGLYLPQLAFATCTHQAWLLRCLLTKLVNLCSMQPLLF